MPRLLHDPRFLAVTALFAAAAFLAACGGGPPGSGATAPDGVRMAPDFALEDLEGRTVRLSDSAGKVRLVDFWTTWCPPCREEIPMFKELQEKYAEHGFELLAISMDEGGAQVVKPFLERFDVPYTNLIGDDETAEAFGGVLGYPTAFLVDGEGKVVTTWLGPKPRRVVEGRIRELLGLEPSA
jgi:thiol-disulfide isomerase/thioredoxin